MRYRQAKTNPNTWRRGKAINEPEHGVFEQAITNLKTRRCQQAIRKPNILCRQTINTRAHTAATRNPNTRTQTLMASTDNKFSNTRRRVTRQHHLTTTKNLLRFCDIEFRNTLLSARNNKNVVLRDSQNGYDIELSLDTDHSVRFKSTMNASFQVPWLKQGPNVLV